MHAANEPQWLTIEEASAIAKLHPGTLREARKAGDLVASGGGRKGHKILIRRDDLEDWLRRRGNR